MTTDATTRPSSLSRCANFLETFARCILFLQGAVLLGVVPWIFGGNSPLGSRLVVFTASASVLPFFLWLMVNALRRVWPGPSFWVPLVCWGLLGVQIALSLKNISAELIPFVHPMSFKPIAHRENWPSTAFWQSTQLNARLWLAYALLALTARHLGLGRRMFKTLLILLVVNATALALLGFPFKFSGEKLMLGRFPMQEWYFYSTFVYHNHWAAYALLALAAAVGLFFSSRKLIWKCVLAGVAGILLASTLAATARLGTLFLGAMTCAAFIVAWRQAARRPRFRRVLLAGALAGLLIFGGGVTWLLRSGSNAGGHRTFSGLVKNNPFTSRFHLVEDSWKMISDKPLFGWGAGAFMAGFRQYQRPETRIVYNNNRITLYDHPHNDWIERLAELGVVGFVLLLTPAVYWGRQVWGCRPFEPLELWPLVGLLALFVMAWGDSLYANLCIAGSTIFFAPLVVHRLCAKPAPDQRFLTISSNQGNP